MIVRRSDLPLKNDAASRFLPPLFALLVFVAALALAAMMVLNGMITRWERDASGTLTIQVMPDPTDKTGETRTLERVETVLALVRATPGVASAQALAREDMLRLLEPWLGVSDTLRDLPLPRLIDVTLVSGAHIDAKALHAELAQTIPGTSVEDHRVWLSKLLRLGRTIEALGGGVLILIGIATAAAAIFVTRTGLAIHREVIEVLHLIGAQDDYIARQFGARAFSLGLRGGLLGLLGMAVPVLLAVAAAAHEMQGGLIPDLWLAPWHWVLLISLPVLVALLSWLTARLTVHAALADFV